MISKNYRPIYTSSTKETFFEYISSLRIPQIDYFAIGVQSVFSMKSISIMSLPEWQRFFVANEYAKFDPFRRATLYTRRNYIPFNEIDFCDSLGKEIMRQRQNMGIKNGIILMERFPKFNYMITLGTGYSRFDSFDFLSKFHNQLHLLKNDLIKIIEKDAVRFLINNEIQFKHLSNDAK